MPPSEEGEGAEGGGEMGERDRQIGRGGENGGRERHGDGVMVKKGREKREGEI